MSDIDAVVVDSLKALDPEWPIREADMEEPCRDFAFEPLPDLNSSFDQAWPYVMLAFKPIPGHLGDVGPSHDNRHNRTQVAGAVARRRGTSSLPPASSRSV